MLPLIFQRRLNDLGYFSFIAMCATFFAVIIIIVLCSIIASNSVEENNETYHTEMTEEQRDYKEWDWLMLPVFCASMNSLFEGN